MWQPIDASLATEPSGRVRAKRHPLNPSLGARSDDAELVSVDVEGKRAWLSLEDAGAARAAVADGKVDYRDVRADTDLTYEITAGTVKETIRLRKPPAAGSASWRFRLGTAGLTPQLTESGEVSFVDGAGVAVFGMPPVEVWDSSGSADHPPALTGGRYMLEKATDGWFLTVSVDEAWLRDSKRVYPVSVDPTFSFGTDDNRAYKSDGVSCQYCGARFGNPLDQNKIWRSVVHFDLSSLWGRALVSARMDAHSNREVAPADRTANAYLYHATALDINGVGEFLGSGLIGQVGSITDSRFTDFVRAMINNRNAAPYFMFIGDETPNVWTYKNVNVGLSIDTGTAPPAPVRTGPADFSVQTTLSPTLSVNPVSDPDGDPVKYCFQVATGPDGKSGVVVNSGCQSSPSWTVPVGVLQDGVSYTWLASAYSGITTTPSSVGHFKVDQRIGERGPAPVDTVGPVTVNLAMATCSPPRPRRRSPRWVAPRV